MTAFSLTADHIAQAMALQAQAKTASDTPFIDALADVIAKEAGADLEFAWPFAAGVVDKMAQDATSLSPTQTAGSTKGIFNSDLARQYLHGDRINSAGDIVDVPDATMRARRMLIPGLLGEKARLHDRNPGATRTIGQVGGGLAGGGLLGALGVGAGHLASKIPAIKPVGAVSKLLSKLRPGAAAMEFTGGLTGAAVGGGVGGKLLGDKLHAGAEGRANKATVKSMADALGKGSLRPGAGALDNNLGRLQDAFGHQDAESARGQLRDLVKKIDG